MAIGLRSRLWGARARHDELRDLHRLRQSTGPNCPAEVTRSRRERTCASSGSDLSSPATAASLSSHAYAGDQPDVTQFEAMVIELVARFRRFPDGAAGDGERLTLVYDAGQNSDDNQTMTLDGDRYALRRGAAALGSP